jgi:hypothetical protein
MDRSGERVEYLRAARVCPLSVFGNLRFKPVWIRFESISNRFGMSIYLDFDGNGGGEFVALTLSDGALDSRGGA